MATSFAASPAGLSQEPGKAGCVASGGSKGQCAKGRGLGEAMDVAVSPDGRNVYVAASGSNALAVFDRLPGRGRLRQQPGAAGCIAKGGVEGCARAVAVDTPEGVAVSPDGRDVYLASSSSVAIFARDLHTGGLRQKRGKAACVSASGSGGACRRARLLGGADDVAVSPDGRNVYVSTRGGLASFERDPRTGGLRQQPGASGCVSVADTGGACVQGRGLGEPFDLVVSPDGRNVYLANYLAGSLAVFDRDRATGALTQQAGIAGCISQSGSDGACQQGRALDGATAVAVSPDGRSVYVAGSDEGGLAILDRNPADGSVVQPPEAAGCVTERGSHDGCAGAIKLRAPQGVAVSPDGRAVYVIGDSALSIFDRNRASGALVQAPGKAGCIAEHGAEGHCQDGTGLADGFHVAVSPDGRNAYGVSIASSAVSVFGR